MKTLYLECSMGAAGDMLMAALLELHSNPADFLNRLNGIGLPGVTITAEPTVKCGIAGTHIHVAIKSCKEGSPSHNQYEQHARNEHSHSDFHDIGHLIGHLNISDTVRRNALAVYKLIAEAESHVHGVPVSQIHFHEVGELDAVADIVGVCMLLEELTPEHIVASAINTGSGHVRCAHGILPVPAPATAHILRNIPMYSDNVVCGELCTPTGAALLRHFACEFRKMPVMTVTKLGYGMGKKDFEKANCVRAFFGEADIINEEVAELVCNLDDMTPETVAFASQLFFSEGALDVYTTPIGMKKGRLGLSLTCMCRTEDREKMLSLMFKHTTTLGIREYVSRRYALQKERTEVDTKYGKLAIKTSSGFGVKKSKPEYEELANIAREQGVSIQEILQSIPPVC